MVTSVIVDVLDESDINIAKGRNLFAERSIGDQYVIVSCTSSNGDAYISELRSVSVNILVVGWDIREAAVIAEDIAKIVLSMEGKTYINDNGFRDEKFNFASVTIRNWPTLIPDMSKIAFTLNADIVLKQLT